MYMHSRVYESYMGRKHYLYTFLDSLISVLTLILKCKNQILSKKIENFIIQCCSSVKNTAKYQDYQKSRCKPLVFVKWLQMLKMCHIIVFHQFLDQDCQ